jgi:hypothetical protein
LVVFEVLLGVAGSVVEVAFVDCGGAAVCPVVLVVDVVVSGFGLAAWSLAVAVAGGDGFALCGPPDSGFAADV